LIEATNGRFFSVRFRKQDGSIREMVARTGVGRYITGKGLRFDPKSKGLIVVFDVEQRGYRIIRLENILSFRCGNLVYKSR